MAVKKRQKLFFIVNMDIFGFDIFVSCGQSNEEIIKSLKTIPENEVSKEGRDFLTDGFKANIENPPNGCDAYCIILDTGDTLLRIIKYPEKANDYGILIHEIFHAVSSPFMKRGLKLSCNSEEAYAYAMGYVSEKIFQKLWI